MKKKIINIVLLFFIPILIGCGQTARTTESTYEIGTGIISGKVYDINGNSASGVVVYLRNSSELASSSIKSKSAQTDTTKSDGSFSFNNVSDGTYNVQADQSDQYKAIQKNVIISGGNSVSLGTLTLAQTGAICGTAQLLDKSTHLGISIFIPGTSFNATTNTSGNYTIVYIPCGTYEVYASYSGYQSSSCESISVQSSEATTAPSIVLIPTAGSSTGGVIFTITDSEDLTGVSSADVKVGGLTKTANTSGICTFETVIVGSQSYTVTKEGYVNYTGVVNVVGSATVNESVSMTPSITIPQGLSVSISGSGQLTLSWTANSESDLAGYNIYRSTSSSSDFAKINSSSITANSYVDSGLSSTTYYYKITAINTSGRESKYSGIISSGVAASGVTWNQATTSASFSYTEGMAGASLNSKLWITGGSNGSIGPTSPCSDVWSSTDGITWTNVTSGAFDRRSQHTSLVFNSKIWIIGGANNISSLSDVWSSTDGITWTQATASAGFGQRSGHASVVYDNKIWVIGGYSGGKKNDVWYSTDGATWAQATGNAAFSARQYLTCSVFDNKMWVIGGYQDGAGSSGYLNDVWYSTDGITWTQTTASAGFSKRYNHASVEFDNSIWVIGGCGPIGTGYGDNNDVWFSKDGITWYCANSSSFPTRRNFPLVVSSDNKLWVIGGWNGNVGVRRDVWWSE